MRSTRFLVYVLAAAAVLIPGVAYADNVTLENVILDTSNMTISAANVTGNITIENLGAIVEEHDERMITAAEEHDERMDDLYNSLILSIMTLIIVFGINFLAFQQKNVFLYSLCVPVDMIFGFSFAVNYEVYTAGWTVGMVVAVIGTFCLFRVAIDEIREIKKKYFPSGNLNMRRFLSGITGRFRKK